MKTSTESSSTSLHRPLLLASVLAVAVDTNEGHRSLHLLCLKERTLIFIFIYFFSVLKAFFVILVLLFELSIICGVLVNSLVPSLLHRLL